jgi:hypothetical protein
MQILVSVGGIGLMTGVAWVATWYRTLPTLVTVPPTVPVEHHGEERADHTHNTAAAATEPSTTERA